MVFILIFFNIANIHNFACNQQCLRQELSPAYIAIADRLNGAARISRPGVEGTTFG